MIIGECCLPAIYCSEYSEGSFLRTLIAGRGIGGAFTRRYQGNVLVYAEELDSIDDAIAREKEIRGWRRSRKDALVAASSPIWADLADAAIAKGPPRCARDDRKCALRPSLSSQARGRTSATCDLERS